MKKNKLQKFAELLSFPNVYENYDPENPKLLVSFDKIVSMENGWGQDHFKNNNPLIVELACGKGDYTLGLASKYKDKNFVGVDIKGARIWKGAKIAIEKNIHNAAFLRTRIEQLNLFFLEREIQEIWITFPDPFYHAIIQNSGIVHLKTDSQKLYEYSLEVIRNQKNWKLVNYCSSIYDNKPLHPDISIKTHYENMHLADGKKITYISFQKL